MSREKKVIDRNMYSKDDAETIFSEFAACSSEIKKIEAEMEIKINEIRKANAPRITKLNELKQIAFDKLEVFANNSPELFDTKKSVEFTHGILGYRTGTPKLKTLKGWTWPKVLEKVKQHLPDFVHVKEELNKAEIIAQRNEPEMKPWLKTIGVEVDQEETFYVAPKTEEVPA